MLHTGGPFVTHGRTICYTREDHLLHTGGPFVTHGRTICYTREDHLLHTGGPFVTHGRTILRKQMLDLQEAALQLVKDTARVGTSLA